MPTATSAPPFFDIIITAWRDAVAAWGRLPLQSAIICGILLVEMLVKMATDREGETLTLADFVRSAVLMLALIPYELALYRAYILGEVAQGYPFDFSPRFRRFLFWTVLVSIPIFIVNAGSMLAPATDGASGFRAVIFLAVFVGMVVLMISSALFFPAIAVDAPGATFANAIADVRKSVLSVVAVFVAAFLPVFVMPLTALILSSPFGIADSDQSIAYRLLEVFFAVLSTTAYVVGMARLYETLADRLKGGTAPFASIAGD